jgi:hypothetical protein
LLVGSTIALIVGDRALDRERHRAVRLTEYLGLAFIFGAAAVTAPFLAVGRPLRSTG